MIDDDPSVFWPSLAVASLLMVGFIGGNALIESDRERTREQLRPLTERIQWEQENAHLIAACVKQHRLDWKTCASAEYHTRSK